MSDASAYLADRLLGEGKKTLDFFRGLPGEDWTRQVYTEGARWTVQEVLVHFVNAENGVYRLLVNIIDGGDGVPQDFDLNRYNEKKVDQLKGTSTEALLAEFWESRLRTISLARRFSPEDLEKIGRHPFLGLARIEDIVKLMYRHNQIHQREIRRQLNQPPAP